MQLARAARADGKIPHHRRNEDVRNVARREPDALSPHRSEARKLDVDAYSPGARLGAVYTPSPLDTTTRCRLVSTLVTVTVAPGTAEPP
jgi:hypothetical protein